MKNNESKKVFISYSHQDNLCVQAIVRFLVRQGYDVWIDVNNIKHGENWAKDIDDAIDKTDVFLAIISKNSVRRPEVIREINLALNRKNNDKDLVLVFVSIGNVHESWMTGGNAKMTEPIIKYLSNIQYIQINPRGNITIKVMNSIMEAVKGNFNYTDSANDLVLDDSNYIFEAGKPENVYDNDMNNCYYKVRTNDLAPSTLFSFALDNQWLPDEIIKESSEYYHDFLKSGFASRPVQEYIDKFQMDNLLLALIHARQIIINRASILNSHSIYMLYSDTSDDEYWKKERIAFKKLLENGSIVVFLYGDNETTPYIKKNLKYETKSESIEAWNNLCKSSKLYCIRENWETPIDKHSIDIAKHCLILAFSEEENKLLAESFGYDEVTTKEFFTILKEIEMEIFLETHVTGTGNRSRVKGYSRSSFYKRFVVKDGLQGGLDPVLNCIIDENKPFSKQLKKMVDVFYNSLFTNYFHCAAQIPNNIEPKDTFMNQLYLNHGNKEVEPDELLYAFSEFFSNERILDLIESIGGEYYLDNWNIDKILTYRSSLYWREYIELLEYINNRSSNWSVDFNDIEKLVETFAKSIKVIRETEKNDENNTNFVPAYTFRVCIGSKVLDIVCTKSMKKIKQYKGSFSNDKQSSLTIQFQIGDATLKNEIQNTIFSPIKVFDGMTSYIGGNYYFKEISNFLVNNCGFIWIN